MVTSRTLDKLGQDFDAPVLSWKDNLLPSVQKVVSERLLFPINTYRAWGRLADLYNHASPIITAFASVCKKHSQ